MRKSHILGYPVTWVLQWMGSEGYSFKAACKVAHVLGSGPIARQTIRASIAAGKSGRGKVAPLTESQKERIIEVIHSTGEVPPPPPPEKKDEEVETVVVENSEELDKLRDKIQTLNEEIEEHKTKVEELKLAVKEAEENKPRTIILKRWDGKKKTLKTARHYAYEEVLLLASRRKNIFLPGPAGCGKSHLAKQVAKDLDLKYYSINCSAGMSEGHLTGRLLPLGKGGTFEYVMSSYVKAYKLGGLFLADELDAADSNVLLSINTSLSNGYLVLPNNPNEPEITKHKDFVFIGAANTFGRGADRLYVGRNQLDEAYLDRFKIGTVEMDYDPQLEKSLCPDDDLRERLQGYRQRVRENRLERIVSSRFLEEAYEMKTECGWDDEKIDSKLFSGWTQDEIKKARGEFTTAARRW